MTRSLKEAIAANRRRWKYKRLINKLRLRFYDYQDTGRWQKAERIIARCQQIAQMEGDAQ